MGCYLSQLCVLMCTCFLLLLLLNFHFYFLFYYKKDFCSCTTFLSFFFCLLTINIVPSFNLSQTLLGFSQTLFFSFNTKFFLWLLFHLSHLIYLCIITKSYTYIYIYIYTYIYIHTYIYIYMKD